MTIMPPPSVRRALQVDRRHQTHAGEVTLAHQTAGELELPTGRLVIADPKFLDDARLVATELPGGRYPVMLSIARYPDQDERVAAAILSLTSGAPTRSGPRPARWETLDSFGVDSGLACYTDASALRIARAWSPQERGRFWRDFDKALDASYRDTRSFASAVVDPKTRSNMLVFSSGWGDGGYASYLATDARGGPLLLVTDFGLLLTREELDALDEEL
jgi:hypothetical protein